MSYLNYLSEVLGVHQILRPEGLAGAEASASAQLAGDQFAHRLWVFDRPGKSSLTESALFKKMMEALKLDLSEIRVFEFEVGELNTLEDDLVFSAPVLSFSTEATQWLQARPVPPAVLISTFGPRDLEPNPQLKRQAWNDLQKLIPVLSN